MINALSIDLEDWFCVHNLSGVIKREDWGHCELRVVETTNYLLDLLDRFNAKATFFVLGWIADQAPSLVREIERHGHEIAFHGYDHVLLTKSTPTKFEAEIVRGIESLKRAGVSQRVIGFRAPSFTIVEGTKWALSILEKFHFEYDSSVFPVNFHPDYGIPNAPLAPYKITPQLIEVPLGCVEILGRRIPCCGGAYFRLFPYLLTRHSISKCNAQGRPIVFYLHPWELDPEQPRIRLPLQRSIRHYYGIRRTRHKLERLLNDFRFTTIKEMLRL